MLSPFPLPGLLELTTTGDRCEFPLGSIDLFEGSQQQEEGCNDECAILLMLLCTIARHLQLQSVASLNSVAGRPAKGGTKPFGELAKGDGAWSSQQSITEKRVARECAKLSTRG